MANAHHMANTETSLSETAYHELRGMIVRLDYAPGDVLREDEIRAALASAEPGSYRLVVQQGKSLKRSAAGRNSWRAM